MGKKENENFLESLKFPATSIKVKLLTFIITEPSIHIVVITFCGYCKGYPKTQ